MPPSRNLGVGNASCGGHQGNPAALIVSPGARKEKLRRREFASTSARAKPLAYVELRAASAFSFLDGASLPEDLVEEAARREIPAVALVDANGVYGAPRFYKAAKAAGVRAIVGAADVSWGRRGGPRAARAGQAPPLGTTETFERLTLLVENRDGYRNLCRLLTSGALGKPKGQASVSWDQVAAHAEGLHVPDGRRRGAAGAGARAGEGWTRRGQSSSSSRRSFPGGVHVELQRHSTARRGAPQPGARSISRGACGLPVLATNGVRFARAKDGRSSTSSPASATTRTLDRRRAPARRERASGTSRRRGDGGALRRPAGAPSAAPRSSPSASTSRWRISATAFPTTRCRRARRRRRFLRQLTVDGARERFRPLTAKAQRADRARAAIIEKLELAGYFLIVWDIVQLLPAAATSSCRGAARRPTAPSATPRHHGRRSGGDGAALRALPLGGARRVARHRPRSAERRPARARHPARLREVRAARRGDDRQRHHLPRPQRRARGRQGARHSPEQVDRAREAARGWSFRDPRRRPRRCRARSRPPASTPTSGACGLFAAALARRSRTCRATSASTRAAW